MSSTTIRNECRQPTRSIEKSLLTDATRNTDDATCDAHLTQQSPTKEQVKADSRGMCSLTSPSAAEQAC